MRIFCSDDQENADCLNSILTDNQRSETWLVFMVHGFTGSLDDDQGSLLDVGRESILARYSLFKSVICQLMIIKQEMSLWVLITF